MVVPMQLSGAAMTSVVTKDQKRLVKLRLLAAKWTLRDDEELTAFVCEWARAHGVDPLGVVPNEVRHEDVRACAPRYESLATFPEREIQLRMLFLQVRAWMYVRMMCQLCVRGARCEVQGARCRVLSQSEYT